MLIIAHLHEGFTYVEVFAFHNAIGLRVIRGDLDVMDAIFIRQVTRCSHKCGAIISNNLGHSTPSAKDILKYKVPESSRFPSEEGATQARMTGRSRPE